MSGQICHKNKKTDEAQPEETFLHRDAPPNRKERRRGEEKTGFVYGCATKKKSCYTVSFDKVKFFSISKSALKKKALNAA